MTLEKEVEQEVWIPPKKVFLHSYHPDMKAALDSNPNLYEYRHLTGWYFHPKGSDELIQQDVVDRNFIYDPKVFERNFIDNPDLRFSIDQNHPWMYKDIILDMESHDLHNSSLPDWDQKAGEYRGICRMMKSAGRDVAVYGISAGAGMFQTNWHIKRMEIYIEDKENPVSVRNKYENQLKTHYYPLWGRVMDSYKKTCEYFKDEVDAMVVSLYIPYLVLEDGWRWEAWLNHAKNYIDAAKRLSGGKPVYVFVQPNYVAGGDKLQWTPIQMNVWNKWIKWLLKYDNCDRIYAFALGGKTQEAGWTDVLVRGN